MCTCSLWAAELAGTPSQTMEASTTAVGVLMIVLHGSR